MTKRLWLFIKRDLATNYSGIGFTAGTIFFLLVIFGILTPYSSAAENFHPTLFSWILFVGGIWHTGKIFEDLHDIKKNYIFLTLPIGNLERFLGRLFLTTVGYVGGLILVFFFASIMVYGFSLIAYKMKTAIFNPFTSEMGSFFDLYLIIHALFFLGAAYFKNFPRSKTILSIGILGLALTIFSFIIFLIVAQPGLPFGFYLVASYGTIIKIVFSLLLVPLCWLVTYLRISESEI